MVGIVRTGVLGSAGICALACSFDAGGLGSGSGDLEQSTGQTDVDTGASSGAGETGNDDTASVSVTNGESSSSDGVESDGSGLDRRWRLPGLVGRAVDATTRGEHR